MTTFDQFDAYCFDLDGTIYVGDRLLPGVKEVIETLRAHDKRVLFITNAPTKTRKHCQLVLAQLGIEAPLCDIMTASYVAACYFRDIEPEGRVFLVGEAPLREECEAQNVSLTTNPKEATHVLVGLDRKFTYTTLNEAMEAVRGGAHLVATNPDVACPVETGFIADTYALASAIATASEVEVAQVVGKPSSYYVTHLRAMLGENSRAIIIGDRLETDIAMGLQHDIPTCLVLTGASQRQDIIRTNIQPTYIIETMHQLLT